MNEQEEVMEKVNEKGKSGIRKERIKILRDGFIKPEVTSFTISKEIEDSCSDMASVCAYCESAGGSQQC